MLHRSGCVLLSLLALISAGCARTVPPGETPASLEGLELPLTGPGGVRLAVDGSIDGEGVEVLLELAQPLTTIQSGCYERMPSSPGTVRFPVPGGDVQEAAEVTVPRVRIGGRMVGTLTAALQEGEGCYLTLGSDTLGSYAITVDPARRVVRIGPSQPREVWGERDRAAASGTEHRLLELVRDPNTDWPMVAARAAQGEDVVTGPFILVTSAAESTIAKDVVQGSGLQTGPAFLRDLGFPKDLELPKSVGGDVVTLGRLELAPDFGLKFAALRLDDDWSSRGALGTLAGDVWGHFITTFDPTAGVLWLERPGIEASGDRQRCAGSGDAAASEEGCFVLHQQDHPDGVQLSTTVWRDLPRGARVYLEPLDAKGQELDGMCRIGLSFARSDRGVSAAHLVPWPGLERSLPPCADQLERAASVRFSVWEEGPLEACPGTCAFVQDLGTGRVSCECQSSAGAMGEGEEKFLEFYRDVLEKQKRQRPDVDPEEPADP